MIEELMKNYVSKDNELTSNLANISAILYNNLKDINWLGFYLLDNDILNLGPFQGLQAISKIKISDGVCGKCVQERQTILVDDVHNFCGHIACDIRSKSEIVIPIFKRDGSVFGVLDVDAPIKSRFKEEEKLFFESIVKQIEELL